MCDEQDTIWDELAADQNVPESVLNQERVSFGIEFQTVRVRSVY